MVRDYGVNYFKFDGFRRRATACPAPGRYPGDVEALLDICDDLRRLKPDVFLNPTTGTWPSPFWLLWADAIWRQESDAGFLGKGSDRQQWITYRDNATYHATVRRGPLYPISSLMLHGIMIHKMSFKNPYDPQSPGVSREPADVLAEIRSYFATGTCMQELHIDPALMTGDFVGRAGRGRELVAGQRRRAGRHALDRRRSGQGRGVRLGVVGQTERGPVAAQPVGSAGDNCARCRAKRFELPAGAAQVVFAPQSLEAGRRRAPIRLAGGTRHSSS